MYRDGTEVRLGRYCGFTAPGPVESNRGAIGIKLFFRANEKGVYSGFKARYSFETAKPVFGGKRNFDSLFYIMSCSNLNNSVCIFRLRWKY